MKHVFEIHQIKSSETTSGYIYEVDGRVLEKLSVADQIYADSESKSELTIKEIVTYGKSIEEIFAPMGGKLILNAKKKIDTIGKYLFG